MFLGENSMTKKELIEKLKEFPDDAQVTIMQLEDFGRGYKEIYVPVEVINFYEVKKGEPFVIVISDGN
jgi:methyl coenzyme M reductase gamma subunit